jgi:hypothetical protein
VTETRANQTGTERLWKRDVKSEKEMEIIMNTIKEPIGCVYLVETKVEKEQLQGIKKETKGKS